MHNLTEENKVGGCPFHKTNNHQEKPDVYYASYLKIQELFRLQNPLSEENDEITFQMIHQAKELIMNISYRNVAIFTHLPKEEQTLNEWRKILKKILHAFKSSVSVLSLCTTTIEKESFLRFSKYFGSASGFQSSGFRKSFEIQMTSLANLAEKPFREAMKTATLEERWQHLYWHKASVSKDCLNNFLSEDGAELLQLAIEYQDKNIYTLWQNAGIEIQEDSEILRLLQNIQNQYEAWKMAHLNIAIFFHEENEIGSGGSEFRVYLDPKNQDIQLFH